MARELERPLATATGTTPAAIRAIQYRAAINEASFHVAAAIGALEAAKRTPSSLVAEHFGLADTSPESLAAIDELINDYRRMYTGLQTPPPMRYRGRSTTATSQVVRWQKPGSTHWEIQVFDLFFASHRTNNNRAQTIVHEMSHMSAGTRDYRYEHRPGFDSLPAEKRQNNADHFENFANSAWRAAGRPRFRPIPFP